MLPGYPRGWPLFIPKDTKKGIPLKPEVTGQVGYLLSDPRTSGATPGLAGSHFTELPSGMQECTPGLN